MEVTKAGVMNIIMKVLIEINILSLIDVVSKAKKYFVEKENVIVKMFINVKTVCCFIVVINIMIMIRMFILFSLLIGPNLQ
jgi:hypothetical protein